MADEIVVPVVVPVVEKDELTLAKEALAKAEEERDNYKNVALKRLGKLPGDAEFLDKDGEGKLSVAEQVRIELLNREVEGARKVETDAQAKLIKENSELRLALKNQPNSAFGGAGGSSLDVKDNVFSPQQLVVIRQQAEALKKTYPNIDVEKYVENAKSKILARR
jgi:hypothetical protein